MRPLVLKSLSPLIVLIAITACQQSPQTPESSDAQFISEGRLIAEQNCVTCHSIETTGDSPRSDAPPLRTISGRYNMESLSDDFREHLHVGHPDMPDFDFNVKETEALLAYLRSIQEMQGE